MTALRFALLAFTSLFLAVVGGTLWFAPLPATATGPRASSAILASSASIGFGALIPQIALAVPAVESGNQNGTQLLALAPARTPTPRRTATLTPTTVPTEIAEAGDTPEPTDTPSPTDVPSPTEIPSATAIPSATNTSAPTSTPGPTNTTAPTNTRPPLLANLTQCGDITAPGTYTLAGPLTATRDCINVRSTNVVLDCNGQSIEGSNYAGYGIAVRTVGLIPQRNSSVEIRECNVSQFRYGIYVEGSTGLYVHDNNVSGNFSDVDDKRFGNFLGMSEGGGIRINNSIGARIEGNTTNDQAIGIDVRGSSNVKVRGNTSSNNTAWGVNFWSTSASEISGNTTNDNIRTCRWGAGVIGPGCDAGGIVLQYASSGNLVSNNQVLGRNGNGIFIKAHAQPCGNNNVISNNRVDGALYNSIELGFCTGTQIVGNTLTNGMDGIWMGFMTGTVIRDNTIEAHRNHGIIAHHVHDNTIANNRLLNDSEAIYLYWEPVNPGDFNWINVSQYRTFNNTITGNTIQNNTGSGIHLKDANNNKFTNNMLLNNGRNWWFEGNTDGNQISGNNDNSWLPGLFFAYLKP